MTTLSEQAKAYADRELKRREPSLLRKRMRAIPATIMVFLWFCWSVTRLPVNCFIDKMFRTTWADQLDGQFRRKCDYWEEWYDRPY